MEKLEMGWYTHNKTGNRYYVLGEVEIKTPSGWKAGILYKGGDKKNPKTYVRQSGDFITKFTKA